MNDKHLQQSEMQDEYLDLLIRTAFKWQELKDAQEIIEEGEREKYTENDEQKARVLALFRTKRLEYEKAARRKAWRRSAIRTVPRAIYILTSILLAIIIIAPLAVARVEPIRACVLSLLIEINDRYATISLQEATALQIPDGWTGEYYLGYLPEGYAPVLIDGTYAYAEFSDSEGGIVKFSERTPSDMVAFDSEDGLIAQFDINGQKASLIEKDGACRLIWTNGEKYFILTTNVPNGEAIRIAESVYKIISK